MHFVPRSEIPSWTNINGWSFPASVDVRCPHCSRLTNIPLQASGCDPQAGVTSGFGVCPACHQRVRVAAIEPKKWTSREDADAGAVVLFPTPREDRSVVIPEGILPERVDRAYRATLDAFNAGLWSPCIASCRRTLEGIASDMLPQDQRQGTLGQQLRKLPEHVNLSQPLLELADLLRRGGNIGAHFDLEREPNAEVALAMLELLEYFIRYVYLLSSQAKGLERRLEALDGQTTPET
jgi:Domain of unknown function (DUF4145)